MPTVPIPNIWFDMNALEAAEFWTGLIPDSAITRVMRAPSDNPSMQKGGELTVEFTLGGRPYVGINGGPQFPFTEAFSFAIACDDQAEVDHYWAALTEGGSEGQCGWCKDRFGMSWQVVPKRLYELFADPDPVRAEKASKAMLKMHRIVVQDLEDAVAA